MSRENLKRQAAHLAESLKLEEKTVADALVDYMVNHAKIDPWQCINCLNFYPRNDLYYRYLPLEETVVSMKGTPVAMSLSCLECEGWRNGVIYGEEGVDFPLKTEPTTQKERYAFIKNRRKRKATA